MLLRSILQGSCRLGRAALMLPRRVPHLPLAASIRVDVFRWCAVLPLVFNLAIQLDGAVAARRRLWRILLDQRGVLGLDRRRLLLLGQLELHAAGAIVALQGPLLMMGVQVQAVRYELGVATDALGVVGVVRG